MERVRYLLSEAKLSGSFWGKALYTDAHVINLSPVVVLQADVPNKVWYGKDVSYNHLRVFGSKAFVHVPKDERSKLDAKIRECIFIGYGHDEFYYRFYDPVENKLVITHYVIFVEDQTIEDINKIPKHWRGWFWFGYDPGPHTDMSNVANSNYHYNNVKDYITNEFGEILSSYSSHNWYQYDIFRFLFFSMFKYALFTYLLSVPTIYL